MITHASILKSFSALMLVAVLASCNSKSDNGEEKMSPDVVNNPTTGQQNGGNVDAVPVFTFEKENHEFGEIQQGEKVTYAFKFKNTGKASLVISSANASCGCTVPEYTKSPVKPGEGGFITVTFDSSGKSGMTSKTITLIANTIPNTKVLTVSADIQATQPNS